MKSEPFEPEEPTSVPPGREPPELSLDRSFSASEGGVGAAGAPDALVGREVVGKYRIEHFLAKGGMGRVYVAIEKATGRRVALKTLAVDARDALFRRRFFNEAAMSASLTHPNVVEVLDYGVDEGHICFIVMELLEGETITQRCKREPRLPALTAIHITRQICAALVAAHKAGFVHRDLKPSNLFLLGDADAPIVKVLDFGLAKRLATDSSLTQTGSFLGSPSYMSPEQITGGDITVAADLYNVGLVLYRMILGRPPFVGEVSSAVLVDHATKAPPPFGEIGPDLPPHPEVEWVVMRCLEKVPSDRFRSAEQLDHALAACERRERGELDALTFRLVNGALRIGDGRGTPAPVARRERRPIPWAYALVGVGIGLIGSAGGLLLLGAAWFMAQR